METPQHGNASTRKRTQKWVWVRFLLFSRIIGNPLKTKKCRGISDYFGSVSAIFTFDSFPVFLGPFLLFLGQFPVFRKSFKLSVCWSVSPFFGSLSFFLGQFPVFRKSFKLSVCWSVSPFFGSVSSFLGSVSNFQKKF